MFSWRAAVLVVLMCGIVNAQPAEVIFHNGKVVTVDRDDTIAEAVAIGGGKVLAVGTDAQVMKLRGDGTKVIDLKGRAVLPGLIDSHSHAPAASMHEFDGEIPPMADIADVLAYVRKRAAASQPGDWIVLQQVFITRLKEQRYPTRAELDEAAPHNPVAFRTGPDASLNSLALKHYKITRDSEAPPGSKIEKDPKTGEPTGILRKWDSIVIRLPSSGRSATPQDRYDRLLALIRDYNAVGLTAFADRNAGGDSVKLYQQMLDRGELTARVALSRAVGNSASLEATQEQIRRIAQEPLFTDGSDMLRIVGIKMFLDGGMLTGSAYMLEPWGVSRIYAIDDPAYRGLLFIDREKLLPIVRTTLESKLQFTAHSVGDGAVTTLVSVYDELAKDMDIRPMRPCVTHCNFMTPASVATMAKLGVVCDIQPAWLWLDGKTLSDHFGDKRLAWFQPLKSIFDAGGIVGGGSDHMQKIGSMRSVNPYNPFLGMWITIAREPRGMTTPLHPEQSLTRMQAIRMYTLNNAHLMFLDDVTGSLEPGKAADLVVLDRDILTCPVDQIKDIQADQTWLAGKMVHERK